MLPSSAYSIINRPGTEKYERDSQTNVVAGRGRSLNLDVRSEGNRVISVERACGDKDRERDLSESDFQSDNLSKGPYICSPANNHVAKRGAV